MLVSAESRTVAARRRLSFAGIVSVALALSEKGVLAADPEVELIGLPETDAGGASMTEIARDAVEIAFDALPKPRRRDPDAVAEAMRRARARRHCRALEEKADLPRPRSDGLAKRYPAPCALRVRYNRTWPGQAGEQDK